MKFGGWFVALLQQQYHAAFNEGLLCENEAPNNNSSSPNNEQRILEHFFSYSDFSLLNTTYS